jgi:hypothetical protein
LEKYTHKKKKKEKRKKSSPKKELEEAFLHAIPSLSSLLANPTLKNL